MPTRAQVAARDGAVLSYDGANVELWEDTIAGTYHVRHIGTGALFGYSGELGDIEELDETVGRYAARKAVLVKTSVDHAEISVLKKRLRRMGVDLNGG